MKINLKDFGLIYIIGLAMLITVDVIEVTLSGAFSWGFNIILFGGLPGIYFWRNRCDLKTAALISILFGGTIIPLFLTISWLFLYQSPPGWYFYIVEFFNMGIIGLVAGMIAYFIVKKIKS